MLGRNESSLRQGFALQNACDAPKGAMSSFDFVMTFNKAGYRFEFWGLRKEKRTHRKMCPFLLDFAPHGGASPQGWLDVLVLKAL